MLKQVKGEDGKPIERVDGLPFVDSFFGGRSVVDINRALLNKFVEQRERDGASPAYINRNLALLRRMLELLAEENGALVVPKFPRLKEPDARKGFCTREQFAALFKELPQRLHALVLFLYTTGCRSGEAKSLLWSQVDWSARVIRVAASQTKNEKPRTIPLAPVVFERLQAIPEGQRGGKLFPVGNFRKAWQNACVRAGLGKLDKTAKRGDKVVNGGYGQYEGLTVHDFRRSAIRNLREDGVGEVVAMRVSGHLTNEVFKRYDIVIDEEKSAAVDKVGEKLASILDAERSRSGQVRRRSRRRKLQIVSV